MTEFVHEGTKIELLPTGRFRTTINGKQYLGDSLAGVKKKIDNAAKDSFKPFNGLREDRYNKTLAPITVSGVKAPRKGARSYNSHHEFILANGTEVRSIMADSPENKVAWQEWKDHKLETERLAKVRSEEEDALRDKIKFLDADSYAPAKPTAV